MNKLIAFTGYKGSGKDTAAEVLTEAYGFTKVAFADPLREIGHRVFGFSYEEMLDPHRKEQKVNRWPYQSPRKVLQTVGTEMFRTHYPGTWIEVFKRKAAELDKVVITDLRFPDEEEAVRELGGVIIRINRQGVELSDPHPSEAFIAQMTPDFEIVNDFKSAADFQGYLDDWLRIELRLNAWEHL